MVPLCFSLTKKIAEGCFKQHFSVYLHLTGHTALASLRKPTCCAFVFIHGKDIFLRTSVSFTGAGTQLLSVGALHAEGWKGAAVVALLAKPRIGSEVKEKKGEL